MLSEHEAQEKEDRYHGAGKKTVVVVIATQRSRRRNMLMTLRVEA